MLSYIKVFLDASETVDMLSEAEAGRLFKALLHYGNGKTDELPGQEKLVFGMLRAQIDRDNATYRDKADIARENGKKGGRPRTNVGFEKTQKTDIGFSETQSVFEKPTKTQDKEEDKDKDKDKDKDYDKDISEADASCGKRRGSRPSPPEPTPSEFEIPLNDGTSYNVPLENIAVYKTLYPAVDVEQEIRNMIGWSLNNPTKKKTRSGIKRFIGSWLQGEQNKGKRGGGYSDSKKSVPTSLQYEQRTYTDDELKSFTVDLSQYANDN